MVPGRAAFALCCLAVFGFGATDAAVARSLRIATFGTSITKSGGWQLVLRDKLTACGVQTKIAVVAKGGATSAWALEQLPKVLEAKPDVVTIEFAMNDALNQKGVPLEDSRANLQKIVAAIAPARPVFIITNRAYGVHGAERPRLAEYYDVVREVARSAKAELVEPDYASAPQDGTGDGLHPTKDVEAKLLTPLLARAINPNC